MAATEAGEYFCPECDTLLVETHGNQGLAWYCPGCRGRLLGAAVLRRSTARSAFNELWQAANSGQGQAGRQCPAGGHSLSTVTSTAGGRPVPVDVCTRCGLVWFDTNELETLPAAETERKPELPPEAREVLALAQVEAMAAERRREAAQEGPDEIWKLAPALLGMPVEVDAPDTRTFPWLTASLALIVSGISLAVLFGDTEAVFDTFACTPANVAATLTYTWLTAFFLHGSFMHLLGNMYFMVLFGYHLEDSLGAGRLALMLLAATYAGALLHALVNWGSPQHAIGASGGISALITCYAVSRPQARFAMLFGYGFIMRWVNLPCWGMVTLWVGMQCLLAVQQVAGLTHVGAFAHLGGAAVGLVAGMLWTERLAL